VAGRLNPVFRSIEPRAHGLLGFSPVDRTVIVACAGIASMASALLGGAVAVLMTALLLALRRVDADRRDHLMLRLRRRLGRRRYDPSREDGCWVTPPT